MQAAATDDTGVLSIPAAFDSELRQELTTAAWLMAAVTVPGLALLLVMVS